MANRKKNTHTYFAIDSRRKITIKVSDDNSESDCAQYMFFLLFCYGRDLRLRSDTLGSRNEVVEKMGCE